MTGKKEIKIGYILRENGSDPVWIEIEENDTGFSITGHIRYGEWGQVDMSIWPAIEEGRFEFLLPEEDVMHVLRFWRDWHLGGMNAGCTHQRDALEKLELINIDKELSYELKRDYLKRIGLHHCAICNWIYGHGWKKELPPAKEIAWIRAFKQKWDGVENGRRNRAN